MNVSVGDEIPPWVMASVSAARMRTMAAILRDPNPVHWDRSVVAARGWGERTINQGPLGLSYMVNMLHDWAGPGSIKRIWMTFPMAVFDEDHITARGVVTGLRDEGGDRLADCEIWLEREGSPRMLDGKATVRIPGHRASRPPSQTRGDATMPGQGTATDPWMLKTPPLTSDYTMHRDALNGREIIVCTVGKTVLHYDARCLSDLQAMLKAHGDWMELGSADEQKDAKDGTVEAWGRSASNPVGGWYGLKNGLRGRFGMYIPPLMEELGLAEVEHNARGNRMRAT